MNLRELRKLVPFWQDILNIKEWTIQVRWGKPKEIDGCVGCNVFSVEELDSLVLLCKGSPNIEETLVHELLHLVFDGHKDVDMVNNYDALHERALNRTAKALMAVRYPQ